MGGCHEPAPEREETSGIFGNPMQDKWFDRIINGINENFNHHAKVIDTNKSEFVEFTKAINAELEMLRSALQTQHEKHHHHKTRIDSLRNHLEALTGQVDGYKENYQKDREWQSKVWSELNSRIEAIERVAGNPALASGTDRYGNRFGVAYGLGSGHGSVSVGGGSGGAISSYEDLAFKHAAAMKRNRDLLRTLETVGHELAVERAETSKLRDILMNYEMKFRELSEENKVYEPQGNPPECKL